MDAHEDAAKTGLRAPADLVHKVLSGAERAGESIATAAVLAHTGGAVDRARQVAADGTSTRVAAGQVVREHVELSRRQGMAAGAALTAIETTSLWGTAGTLTIPAALTGLAADLVSLAWIQARMVVQLAALHGRDPYDREARVADLAKLWEIEGLGDVVAQGRFRWGGAIRRIARPLGRVRILLHMVGLRSLARRVIPLANVPLTATSNAKATQDLADRALEFYAR